MERGRLAAMVQRKACHIGGEEGLLQWYRAIAVKIVRKNARTPAAMVERKACSNGREVGLPRWREEGLPQW